MSFENGFGAPFFKPMTKPKKVTSQELRQLLHHIQNPRLHICIRFRLIGQLWQSHFMRVVLVVEEGVTFEDEKESKLLSIKNLNDIMQFELDQPLFQYEPHYHYEVQPSTNSILKVG